MEDCPWEVMFLHIKAMIFMKEDFITGRIILGVMEYVVMEPTGAKSIIFHMVYAARWLG